MKNSILLFIKICVLWLLFFTVQRIFFLIHYWSDIDVSVIEIFKIPFHGLRIDLSALSYLNGLPFIFLTLSILNFSKKWKNITLLISKILIWISAVLSSIVFASELVTYYEWRAKLSSKIFIHFETPSEIFRTSSGSSTWWFILYFLLQIVMFYVLFRWLIKNVTLNGRLYSKLLSVLFFILYFLVGGTLIGLGVRGGWQEIPISATNAYSTNSQITNDLAVNSSWNFIHMTFEYFNTDYEAYYNKVDPKEAELLVTNLYQTVEVENASIFKTDVPDIIFVTLEGWSAQMIGSLGGLKDVTPHFNALSKEGLLFSKIYATSETSETGHTSIYAGYPTLPKISMSTESAKCRQMPSLVNLLKQKGYASSYYFGGALSYGNIGGFLRESGFEKVTDENDLQHLEPKGNLGIHDEPMFKYYFDEIKKANSPFIYGLFTQSTHAPYDMDAPYLDNYPNNDYVKSMHYADEQIKKFTDSLKTLPNFENTIVVFIADHGKTNFVNNKINNDSYYHIPVLFWGGALKNNYKDSIITKLGSQIDVSLTLLNQLNIDSKSLNWSKDLLNPNTKEWAIITTSYTYGIVTPNGCIIHQFIEGVDIYNTFSDSTEAQTQLKNCRAIIESVYREYKSF